jgi:hypothetical protein
MRTHVDHGESRLWCGHLRACLDATTPSYGSHTTAAAASPGAGVADPDALSRRWRKLPWAKQRELFKSWAQPRASDCYPGDLRLGWWWDLRSLGVGMYASWSDDDISTVVTTTTYYQVWLSASGTRVYRRESSWCDLPANLVIPVVLAVGAFVVAGAAVGAAKLLLWLW